MATAFVLAASFMRGLITRVRAETAGVWWRPWRGALTPAGVLGSGGRIAGQEGLILLIFPKPRELQREGEETIPWPMRLEPRPDPGLPVQGYSLSISGEGAEIGYADEAGLRYARDTLAQLEEEYPDGVPALRIRDWPDFPVRGYMLDVSRDRVPARATLERIVQLMRRLRLNHLQLYTEHTFAFAGHETVWKDASPLDAADIQWLDALCVDNGIELAANQNCFGHMGRWLQHPEYRHLAEAPDGWKMSLGIEMPASVLQPCEESSDLVLGLLDELLPNFRSARVNINCDETFELGRGASAALVEEQGVGRTYLDFVRRIMDHLLQQGKQVLFWGDVLRNHPELIAELPDDGLVALVWNYEAPGAAENVPDWILDILSEFGMTKEALDGFRWHVRNFAAAGMPFWVCPGTSGWNSLLGRLENARGNLLDAVEVGLAEGARGFLITDWGDNGHLQPLAVSFPPLVLGAGLSWCQSANRAMDLATEVDRRVAGREGAGLGALLESLGGLCTQTGLQGINGSPIFEKLTGGGIPSLGEIDPVGVRRVLEELVAAESAIETLTLDCPDAEEIGNELRAAVRLARHGAWQIAAEASLDVPSAQERLADLEAAVALQRKAWLARSRPGGLDDSLAQMDAAFARYREEAGGTDS